MSSDTFFCQCQKQALLVDLFVAFLPNPGPSIKSECSFSETSSLYLIPAAAPDGGAAHGGERLPRQPDAGCDGGAAGDAGEEGGTERRVQRQLDRPHRQPAEGGHSGRGGHAPVETPGGEETPTEQMPKFHGSPYLTLLTLEVVDPVAREDSQILTSCPTPSPHIDAVRLLDVLLL